MVVNTKPMIRKTKVASMLPETGMGATVATGEAVGLGVGVGVGTGVTGATAVGGTGKFELYSCA